MTYFAKKKITGNKKHLFDISDIKTNETKYILLREMD